MEADIELHDFGQSQARGRVSVGKILQKNYWVPINETVCSLLMYPPLTIPLKLLLQQPKGWKPKNYLTPLFWAF